MEKKENSKEGKGKKLSMKKMKSLFSKKSLIILGSVIVAVFLITLLTEFFMVTRVSDVTGLEGVDARGGEITITYSSKVKRTAYKPAKGLYTRVKLSKDRLVETHTLLKPTKYNASFKLIKRSYLHKSKLFGFFTPKKELIVTTQIEKISVKSLIPPENSNPAPETMDNQLVLQFKGEVRGNYKKGVNIPAKEMSFVKMTPSVSGYFRWSDDSTLTFNFTGEKPKFETKYEFEIYPEKFVNKKYQNWVGGDKRKFSVKTSKNEVYITDFSLKNDINWQTPLTIEFSGNMVSALEVLKRKSKSVVPIKMSPEPGGYWIWENARTIKFRPDSYTGWPVRKTIKVKIKNTINRDSERKWRPGKTNGEYSFNVLPRYQSISSYNLHGEKVELNEDLIIKFSRDIVKEAQIGKRVGNGNVSSKIPFIFEPHIAGEFIWTRRDKLKFRPVNLWSQLKEYKVKLNPGYNPDPRYEWKGTRDFKFKTVENVVDAKFYFTPENRISPSRFFSEPGRYKQSEDVKTEARLWILFDKKIGKFLKSRTDLEDAVKITPAVKGKYSWLSHNLLEFLPAENWKEKESYKIDLTKRLFTHPEQHFYKDKNKFKFETAKNIVSFTTFNEKNRNKKTPYVQWPHESIVITFSKNMKNALSVGKVYETKNLEAKYHPVLITPAIDATFLWKTKRHLIINPKKYLKPEALYSVNLNKGLLPQSESKFNIGTDFYLKTDKNYVNISRFTPQGRVGRRIVIDVRFDKNIKPEALKVGSIDSENLFAISPAIKGDWIWLAPDKLQFKPVNPLDSTTKYKISFNGKNLSDKQFSFAKGVINQKFSFHTRALHVVSSSARFEFNEKDILKQKFYLDFELSDAVKDEDLRKHFSIWYKKRKSNGSYVEVPLLYNLQNMDSGSKLLRKFSVVSKWIDRPASDRRIEYKITEGISPFKGNLNMANSYSSYFYQEKPKHIRLNYVNWRFADRKYKAELTINAPVEPEVLSRYLTIKDRRGKKLKYDIAVTNSGSSYKFKYEITSGFDPGSHYNFIIKEGMLATDGAFVSNTINRAYNTPNLRTELKFAHKGNFISVRDLNKVPILSTNKNDFKIRIHRIYANNVRYFLNNRISSYSINDVAKEVYNKWYSVKRKLGGYSKVKNKQVVTHVDMTKMFKANKYGLYRITIGYNKEKRWFLATDIGIIARKAGERISVWTNSLNSVSAKSNVLVQAVDRWNQVVGSGYTDGNGFVQIKTGKNRVTHLIAKQGEDYSFIHFQKHKDSMKGFDIEGVPHARSFLRSYIYSDRGVYRPGDKVHLVTVTRGKEGALPRNFNVKFRLTDPVGKTIVNERYKLGKDGLFVYDFRVPAEAKTGKWNASVYWGSSLKGNYTFQVEEFIPNKIKVGLKLISKNIHTGEKLKFRVKANNLFGPPASNRPVRGRINLRSTNFKPEGFYKYSFGNADTIFKRIDHELAENKLSDEGIYDYEYTVPEGIKSPSGLRASYSATVIDDGGRAVSSYGSVNVLMYSQFVGVSKLTKDISKIDNPVGFSVVNVDSKGKQIARAQQKLTVKIYRNKKITHYRKNTRGYYRYVTENERVLVEELNDPRSSDGKFFFTPKYSGQHIVEVEDQVGKQVTHYKFNVRGGEDRGFIEIADKVEFKVLNSSPSVNDTLRVEVRTPIYPGKILITGEREKVLFKKVIMVQKPKTVVSIPVSSSFFPNFYLTAMAIKPVKRGSSKDPIYTTGILNVNVKNRSHTPTLKLIAPGRVNPNGKLTVKVKVSDMNNSKMHFTIAAVDEGILSLTKYKLPVMNNYFNRKLRLEVGHYSMYPLIMPYEPDVKYNIHPSGDTPSRSLVRKKRVNPESSQRVKSTALWSGLLKFDKNGEGTVTFDVPNFNGTLRVMAVAFGDKRFASSKKAVVVRDKLVMKPTLPRFLATGDDFIIPVNLFNGASRGDDIKVTLKTTEHVTLRGSATKSVYVNNNRDGALGFAIKVNNILGLSEFILIAEGAGETTRKIIKIPVRTPGSIVSVMDSGSVDKLSPKTIKLPKRFVEGTQDFAMKITSNKLTQFQNGLKYLLKYPHGCLEQTTSKLFPLLYFSDLAESSGNMFPKGRRARYYLKEGIKKIERMQLENGAFSYWEGGRSVNKWAFVYAAHFIVEAKRAGLKIDTDIWNNMFYQLEQMTSVALSGININDRNYGISHYIYSLYVMALGGENVYSKLNYVYEKYGEEIKLHNKARLAASFAILGHKETANKIIAGISDFSSYDSNYYDTGGNFGSSVRDLSIVLDSVISVNSSAKVIPILVDKIANKASYGRWGSTQENAYAFLAIGKALSKSSSMRTKLKIRLGDGTIVPFKREVLLKTPELLKGEVRLEVKGKGEISFLWEATGIDKNPASLQDDKGVKIRRAFLDRNGKKVKLSDIKQGDLLVAEITMKSSSGTLENFAITDLLPMGFEIENTRLATSASLPWIKQGVTPDHLDIRDDRINLFVTVDERERKYYYTVRAVTVGNFKIPFIHGEAMYNPAIFSKADSAQLKIKLPVIQNGN
ncbi:MAG: alpha-2-macroglobulin family protein [Desulfobacterales bacterium]|nr:alpha-2-macroglobulin family protein [Desulfobacterales bacterium]